jgi:hypothetical protein
MLYNGDYSVMQFCNGEDWISMGGLSAGGSAPDCTNDSTATCTLEATRANDDPQFIASNILNGVNILGVTGTGCCVGPSLCPNVGDICDDGNSGNNPDPVFAGFMQYGTAYEPLYVTQSDQSNDSMWKTSTGTDDIVTDSSTDGQINDGQVPNSTTFPAFKLCKDLSNGGFTDWYLPAKDELNLLWINHDVIGNFTTNYLGDYWSSTEYAPTTAWMHSFQNGSQYYSINKTSPISVRCVRRD